LFNVTVIVGCWAWWTGEFAMSEVSVKWGWRRRIQGQQRKISKQNRHVGTVRRAELNYLRSPHFTIDGFGKPEGFDTLGGSRAAPEALMYLEQPG